MITKRNRVPEHFYISSGDSIRELFVLNDTLLVKAGEEDLNARIQSFADSTDLNNIVSRIAAGEVELLYQRTGAYIDTTIFPTTVADLNSQLKSIQRQYNSLPDDIKSEIGSFSKFSKWTSKDFDSFVAKHTVVPEVVVPDVPEEVK